MKRVLVIALAVVFVPVLALAQPTQAGSPLRTTSAKIANAILAAPTSISANATILDWPAKEGDAPAVLRAGTNGWSCFPDYPMTEGNDPMCVDSVWTDFFGALMAHKPPTVSRVGIAYMVAPGGAWGSNTDPYASKQAPDNEWGFDPPHVMIAVPDTKALEGLPTKRQGSQPWVMFAGTPYAHIMVPVVEGKKP